jgi:hypothetical protein
MHLGVVGVLQSEMVDVYPSIKVQENYVVVGRVKDVY